MTTNTNDAPALAQEVAGCQKCGAPVGAPCRKDDGGLASSTHAARVRAAKALA